jgi:uracil-DNA glycosylase
MSIETIREDLVELLALYAELGVDCALTEEAVDWLHHGHAAPGDAIRQALKSAPNSRDQLSAPDPVPAPERTRQRRAGGVDALATPRLERRAPAAGGAGRSPSEPGVAGAGALAARAKNLEELLSALKTFEGCALRATAKNTCFFRGAKRARLMIIGEAPGRDEDLAGLPFVGRAGQLLDRMLAAIGLNEELVHITNVVYWRPPGNRTPTLQETSSCRPFLERQIALVEPELVLLLGGAAAKNVLEVNDGIMRLRGKWKQVSLGGRTLRALPTLHPAYLLRTPAAKRLAWRDLLSLQQTLQGSS